MRLLLLVLVACSSSSSPPPREPESRTERTAPPTTADAAPCKPETVDERLLRGDSPMTKEECECAGGRVNPSIGGGAQAHCAAGETELGPVRLGIEGGWCCKK